MKKSLLLVISGIVIGVILTLVIIAFINGGGLNLNDCIGEWQIIEWTEGDVSKYYMPTITIYKGGTAKGSKRDNSSSDGYYPFTWEIKDDMLVLTRVSEVLADVTSFEVNGDFIKSSDGSLTYRRISE